MLRAEDVWFKRKQRILKGISLSVKPGETIAIRGPNGSGKTTLAMILAGLWRPHKGRVTVDGEDPRGKVYVAFQDARLLDIPVREYLKLIGELKLLPRLEVERYLDVSCRKLSIGWKKRVHLQAAYSSRHKYVILDEPESGVDDVTLVTRTLEALRHKGVIVITHEPRIRKLADRIYRLEGGRLYEDHSAREDELRRSAVSHAIDRSALFRTLENTGRARVPKGLLSRGI